ncbi:probable receptor kinase At1g80640 [Olea europaea subsp. europaea]|uniref:Probable receptor kinase At1g80640 n=1 Tax=Olea europaea subsp. europaea TaxID=158383 RepID=A0A8S0RZ87_OLEEU|nr:probable receptor kinase At1g80640 [Olea europaea subsp. europaea]CAA3021291.1 probable receptor kinase At1g80640 [Olea europaea subsp. europaea]
MAAFSPGIEVGGKHGMGSNEKLLVALIAASTAMGAIILFLLCFWVYHRKHINKSKEKRSHSSVPFPFLGKYNTFKTSYRKGSAATTMDYNVLESATNNFSESEILGKGGFGCVYKATLEENLCAAVKRLEGGTSDAIKEFETEVELLSNIQHPNIISLLGCSVHAETRLIVYELMQNGSLETQLHGPSRGSALTWNLRMKIALDVARGLEYLHDYCHPPIIHRDLKSSNILLDSNFNAKLSDFGLAVPDGAQNRNNVKLSGTLGYVAPEYLLDGKLTDKSDVYAFGIVLLELLLGRKPVEKLSPSKCQSIVTWAMPQLTDKSKLPNIVDPVIINTMDLKHLYQVAAVAVLCVQPEPSYRPLITDVLHSLIPLVPMELGGTLRLVKLAPPAFIPKPSN